MNLQEMALEAQRLYSTLMSKKVNKVAIDAARNLSGLLANAVSGQSFSASEIKRSATKLFVILNSYAKKGNDLSAEDERMIEAGEMPEEYRVNNPRYYQDFATRAAALDEYLRDWNGLAPSAGKSGKAVSADVMAAVKALSQIFKNRSPSMEEVEAYLETFNKSRRTNVKPYDVMSALKQDSIGKVLDEPTNFGDIPRSSDLGSFNSNRSRNSFNKKAFVSEDLMDQKKAHKIATEVAKRAAEIAYTKTMKKLAEPNSLGTKMPTQTGRATDESGEQYSYLIRGTGGKVPAPTPTIKPPVNLVPNTEKRMTWNKPTKPAPAKPAGKPAARPAAKPAGGGKPPMPYDLFIQTLESLKSGASFGKAQEIHQQIENARNLYSLTPDQEAGFRQAVEKVNPVRVDASLRSPLTKLASKLKAKYGI